MLVLIFISFSIDLEEGFSFRKGIEEGDLIVK